MAWLGNSHVVEVAIKGVLSGQACINVFHARRNPGSVNPDNGSLADLLAVTRARWRDLVLPMCGTQYVVSSYNAYIITGRTPNPRPAPTPRGRYTPFLVVYGEQAFLTGDVTLDKGAKGGPKLPSFVAGGMTWVAEQRVRWGRSSSRLPIGVEEDTTENQWNDVGGLVTAADAMPAAWLDDMTVGGAGDFAQWCIYGRYTHLSSVVVNPPVAYTTKIIAGRFSRFVTSQVSRKERDRHP